MLPLTITDKVGGAVGTLKSFKQETACSRGEREFVDSQIQFQGRLYNEIALLSQSEQSPP